MSETDTGRSVDQILTARDPKEFLQRIKPFARDLLKGVDEGSLDIFDATFETDSRAATRALGDAATPGRAADLSGRQGYGLEDLVFSECASFLINVLAALAVARFSTTFPRTYGLAVGHVPKAADGGPADVVLTGAWLFENALERSEIPELYRARFRELVAADPVLGPLLKRPLLRSSGQ